MAINVYERAANNIRILAASMVEKAKSGHPGGAMGGGASTAGNGATNASQSGQFTVPFMPVQRRPDPTMARFAGMSVQHEDDESTKDVNKRKNRKK